MTRLLIELGLSAVLVLAVIVAVALALSSPDRILIVLSAAAAPVLSLTLMAVCAAAYLRHPKLLAALGVAALSLVGLQWHAWLPQTTAPQAHAAPVRIWFDNLNVKNGNFDKIARSIARSRADVVGAADFSDAQAAAADRLFAGLPYRVFGKSLSQDEPRNVIASRYPLEPLGSAYAGDYAVAAVRVLAPSGPFRLLVLHVTRPWPFRPQWEQPAQLAQLARKLNQQPREPVVLVGDFNATVSGAYLRLFARRTGLTPAPAGLGDWPTVLPPPLRMPIENAFAGQGETITARRLAAGSGSDHQPIVIEAVRAR